MNIDYPLFPTSCHRSRTRHQRHWVVAAPPRLTQCCISPSLLPRPAPNAGRTRRDVDSRVIFIHLPTVTPINPDLIPTREKPWPAPPSPNPSSVAPALPPARPPSTPMAWLQTPPAYATATSPAEGASPASAGAPHLRQALPLPHGSSVRVIRSDDEETSLIFKSVNG